MQRMLYHLSSSNLEIIPFLIPDSSTVGITCEMSQPTTKKALSLTLQNMKFMQRRQTVAVEGQGASETSGEGKEGRTLGRGTEEEWHLEYEGKEQGKEGSTPKTRVVYRTSYLEFTNPLAGEDKEEGGSSDEEEREEERGGEQVIGRHSYREFNPEVERIRKEIQERGKANAPEEEIGAVEMAGKLGKGDEEEGVMVGRGARYRPVSKKRSSALQGEGGSRPSKARREQKALDKKGFMKP
ncbi:MAG: hypothetical protein DHS80DRAFT_21344 [Piptocephalis tieghemiana]|nr:MAG: hypothetical protein DHS80DRAFT_21344 [Piptocephalis tieghemiana]